MKIINRTGTARQIPLPSRVAKTQVRSVRSERGGTVGTTTRGVMLPEVVDAPPNGSVEVADEAADAVLADPAVKRMVKARVIDVERGGGSR